MKEDLYYRELVKKMTEIAIVTPQSVGPFTPLYKRVTPYFKEKPWKVLAFSSFITSTILYLLFGSLLVRLASILQFGF